MLSVVLIIQLALQMLERVRRLPRAPFRVQSVKQVKSSGSSRLLTFCKCSELKCLLLENVQFIICLPFAFEGWMLRSARFIALWCAGQRRMMA